MFRLVSDYLGALITILSGVIYVRLIIKEKIKISNFKLVILILIFTFLFETLYLFNTGIAKTLLGYLFYVFLFQYTFGLTSTKAMLFSFSFICFLTISEISIFLILTYLFKVDTKYLYEVFAGSIISNLSISLLFLLISYFLRNFIRKMSKIDIKNTIIIYIFLVFICIACLFYITFSKIVLGISTFLVSAIIILMLIIIFSLLSQTYKNNQLILQYDNLLEFIKKYEVEIDNQRILRHETRNQLLTIKSKLIDKEKLIGVINYIDEIIKDDKKVNHSEYAKLKYLPSNGIRGLFYFKISIAQEKNIKVDINISKNVEKSFLAYLDSYNFNQIGKVLGVYLDNAIDGAEASNDKNIGIEVFIKSESIVFVISNSFNSDVKMFGRSSKGSERGHGLILTNNIINDNARLDSKTEIMDNLYVKKLIIKK